jgi:hypothetical protein
MGLVDFSRRIADPWFALVPAESSNICRCRDWYSIERWYFFQVGHVFNQHCVHCGLRKWSHEGWDGSSARSGEVKVDRARQPELPM